RLSPPGRDRDTFSLTDLTVQISRSGFLKPDSPVTSRHGESEAAATDDVVGARYIVPTSTGFRACDDSATSSRSVRRPDRTSEGSESLSVGHSTGSGLGAWRGGSSAARPPVHV